MMLFTMSLLGPGGSHLVIGPFPVSRYSNVSCVYPNAMTLVVLLASQTQ